MQSQDVARGIVAPDQDLRDRLEAFQLDKEGHHLTFTERLARENFWTLPYARRVVHEYKRFLELTVVAGHTVTPSDAVDQAWHQHLVYTRSYWDELCAKVLRQPLHHGPTEGGQREQLHYFDLYARTLDSYQRVFGEAPPADIWPLESERFRQSIQGVRIDRGKYWLIPKLTWSQGIGGAAALGSPLMIGAMDFARLTDPASLTGPEFLKLYAILIGGALCVSWGIKLWLRSRVVARPSQSLAKEASLGWGATAMLVGGPQRALMTALMRLRAEGKIDLQGSRIVALSPLQIGGREFQPSLISGSTVAGNMAAGEAMAMSPTKQVACAETKNDVQLIDEIMDCLRTSDDGMKLGELSSKLKHSLNRVSVELEDRELWLSSSERLWQATLVAAPLALLTAFGGWRIALGISRDRPVGFLVLMVIVLAIVLVSRWFRYPRCTSQGKAKIKQLQRELELGHVRKDEQDAFVGMHPIEMAAWTAVWGGMALQGSEAFGADASFYAALEQQQAKVANGSWSNSGSGDGGSGCGSGCSGGGGSGCGGGGCGGCGGCGG